MNITILPAIIPILANSEFEPESPESFGIYVELEVLLEGIEMFGGFLCGVKCGFKENICMKL